jgi:hypothetical protein
MQPERPQLFGFTLVMVATLVTSPAFGAVELLRAYRNHDLKDAVTAICIYLIGAPLFAVWWLHRHPVSSGDGLAAAHEISPPRPQAALLAIAERQKLPRWARMGLWMAITTTVLLIAYLTR